MSNNQLAKSHAPVPAVQQGGQLTRREYNGSMVQSGMETATAALAAKAQAQVQARYIMALQSPRNPDRARDRLLAEASRPAFAERAVYRVPRGGKTISGPSIRMAEAILQAWGNVHTQSAIIYEDSEKMIVAVTATDLETNITHEDEVVVRKVVERKHVKDGQTVLGERENSYGDRVFLVAATDDELFMKSNAAKSKSIRTAGLRLVPRYFIDELIARCEETMQAETAKSLPSVRAKMVGWFGELGVSKTELGKFLGYSPDQATVEDMARLRGLGTAIKDGEVNWAEAVAAARAERAPAKPAAEVVEEKPQASQPKQQEEQFDQATGVVTEQPKPALEAAPAQAALPPATDATPAVPTSQTPEFSDWLVEQLLQAPTDRALAKLSVRKGDCRPEDHERVLEAFRKRQGELKK